jgi:hypothetical protein
MPHIPELSGRSPGLFSKSFLALVANSIASISLPRIVAEPPSSCRTSRLPDGGQGVPRKAMERNRFAPLVFPTVCVVRLRARSLANQIKRIVWGRPGVPPRRGPSIFIRKRFRRLVASSRCRNCVEPSCASVTRRTCWWDQRLRHSITTRNASVSGHPSMCISPRGN